jgi:hypothetical protein
MAQLPFTKALGKEWEALALGIVGSIIGCRGLSALQHPICVRLLVRSAEQISFYIWAILITALRRLHREDVGKRQIAIGCFAIYADHPAIW